MIIRNAKPEDKLTAASLIMEAIDDLAKIFTGFDNEESIKKEMENLFSENNNRFSHEYCTVIEINGEVAASVITYPASLMNELNETVIKKLKKRFVNDEKSFLYYSEKIRNSREAFDDEYYIDNLAVSTEFRGKGLSKILITAAEKKGIEDGYEKISIIAEIHNEKAFNIYKHLGYIKDCEIEVLGHRYHHLVKE
jgi:ribosomal protein S18 acetylase RimI-like enzyme